MYTPLEFMNSIPKFYRVASSKKLSANMSKATFEYAQKVVTESPELSMNVATKCLADIVKKMPRGQASLIPNCVNLSCYDPKLTGFKEYPYAPQYLMHCVLYSDWMKHKSVYKVEKSLVRELAEMGIQKRGVPADALNHIPVTSMFIDLNNTGVFSEEVEGLFVYTYEFNDARYLNIMSLVRTKSTLLPLHVAMGFSNKDDGEFMDTEIDKLPESIILKINDWECLYEERKLVVLVLNFLQYLYAANKDVEYVEKAAQTARKNKKAKQEASIKEARVGYRISSTISQSQRKVRYVGEKSKCLSENTRNYPSHFRCAHWHHYWINDPDVPGQKKLIVKWVAGTYVHGNTDSNIVKVVKVKK